MAKIHPFTEAPDNPSDERAWVIWALTSEGGIGDKVTELYERTSASVIIVLASTKPGFEGFQVLTLPEAREAGKVMSEGMRRAIESAPKMPLSRIFHMLSNGEIPMQDMRLLALDVDMKGSPS